MSSVFELLVQACAPVEKFKSMSDLSAGEYHIDAFRLINTKYGVSLAVVIARQIVFLPPRFSKKIQTQQQVDELNEANHIMTYEGMLKGEHVIRFKEFRRTSMDI